MQRVLRFSDEMKKDLLWRLKNGSEQIEKLANTVLTADGMVDTVDFF